MYRCLLTARFKQKLYCLEWTIAVQGLFGAFKTQQLAISSQHSARDHVRLKGWSSVGMVRWPGYSMYENGLSGRYGRSGRNGQMPGNQARRFMWSAVLFSLVSTSTLGALDDAGPGTFRRADHGGRAVRH